MSKTSFATEAEVAAVPFPEWVQDELRKPWDGRKRSDSWRPLEHGQVIRAVRDVMADHGIKPLYEGKRAVKEYTLGGRDNARMFGHLPLDAEVSPGVNLQLGIANSFDKSMGVRIGFGSRVFVCSNGMLVAERVLSMAHRPGSLGFQNENLKDGIDAALNELGDFRENQAQFLDQLAKRPVINTEAHDLILRAHADYDAISVTEIPYVLEQWRNPAHDEFEDRNAYSLLNAFTHVFRQGRGNGGGVAVRNGQEFAQRSMQLARMMHEQLELDVQLDPNAS